MTLTSKPPSKKGRGLLTSLLVLAILNLPLPLWNCYYGFSLVDIYGFDNKYQFSTNGTFFNTVAGLGLAFGLITLMHGLFGLVKIIVFSIDIHGNLPKDSRSNFVNACLVIEVVLFLLTLTFGLALTLYVRANSIFIDVFDSEIVWILMAVTLFLQLVTIPLMVLLSRSTRYCDDDAVMLQEMDSEEKVGVDHRS